MRIKIFLFISALWLLASCSNSNKVPEGILSHKQMVDLLVDIHLSEAINGQRFRLDKTTKNFSNDLYFSICKKHGVDPDVFAQSVLYYGKHPKQYDVIYDQVLNRLNEMEEQVKKEGPKLKPDDGKQ
ncbi:DUF4296 domain-containing protein [Prolixibacter sp. SD074]|jgi:hypothetical protein|uniref:DUF4296 domain-containing protein n=1 Tax=Prolixibacter sp. SD074 TaxID=2652391 RepID=UPI001282D76A|nr:DUF4296 domain-containing protein [Prolixibacter sp. SD074]GET30374.1 hypothetical protein SD074_25760 [Prolixibacter sp. SD074]